MLVPFGRDGSGGESKGEGETDETLEGEVRVANKAEDNATVLPAKGRTLIFFGVAVIASPWRPRRQLACDRRFYYIVPPLHYGDEHSGSGGSHTHRRFRFLYGGLRVRQEKHRPGRVP